MEELVVELNGSGVNTIEPQREDVVATDRLRLRLQTDDRPARVYLRVEGDWAQTLSLSDPNVLVTPEADKIIELTPESASLPTSGRLVLESGYGATARSIDVEVEPTAPQDPPEDTQSQPAPEPGPAVPAAVTGEVLVVVGVLLVAVVTATGGVAVIGPEPPVLIGAGVVVLTAVAGVLYLYG